MLVELRIFSGMDFWYFPMVWDGAAHRHNMCISVSPYDCLRVAKFVSKCSLLFLASGVINVLESLEVFPSILVEEEMATEISCGLVTTSLQWK